jgi:hypothetical protein
VLFSGGEAADEFVDGAGLVAPWFVGGEKSASRPVFDECIGDFA